MRYLFIITLIFLTACEPSQRSERLQKNNIQSEVLVEEKVVKGYFFSEIIYKNHSYLRYGSSHSSIIHAQHCQCFTNK